MSFRLSLRQIRRFILTLAVLLLAGGSGWWLRGALRAPGAVRKEVKIVNFSVPEEKQLDFTLFWEVWRKLEDKYLLKEKIDDETLFYGAIKGITDSLDDPYTVFLAPKENKEAKENLNGTFEGVGIQLGFNEDKRLVVIAPLKGMPAEKAGVRAGDFILNLKDETKKLNLDTAGLSLPEAVEKIRGPKGTKITITFLHEGEVEPYEVEIVRQEIIVPSAEVKFLENDKIAQLQLYRFGDLTTDQWDKAVDEIVSREKDLTGVVLDLRGNPGGYLKGAITLASEFLSQGVIVKQVDYKGETETYKVDHKGRLLIVPLVVLIDKGSASSSEILAGALRDNKRAQLVGVESFGKGTIQEAEDLSSGAGLHITTSKWLTPDGIWLNDGGLKPDVEVKNDPSKPDDDLQLKKAIELLLKQ